jgi:4-amino-4-deoxy-L-arabinose transferase-like glycosyltransferase
MQGAPRGELLHADTAPRCSNAETADVGRLQAGQASLRRLDPVWAAGAVVVLLFVVRVMVAATVELSEDESYYWLWSRHLSFGYYDHPPMVAYWIRLGTEVLGPSPLGVRIAGLLSTALLSALIFSTVCALFQNRAAAWQAVLWLNAGLLLNAAAIVMTPDTPLAFFWVLALFALAKLIETNGSRWWFLLAAAAAGAVLSKYTAVFLAPAVLLWMALSPLGRKWLRRPEPYLAAGLALALLAPMVWWNYAHDWVSFAKQAAHAIKDVPASGVASVAEFLGGQAGLVTPLIFGFCIAGGMHAVRRSWTEGDSRWLLLAATSVPIFLFFLIHSANQKIQPNWPGFLYPSALIAAVALVHELRARGRLTLWMARACAAAAPVGLCATAVVLGHLAFGLIPLPATADPTARMHGWTGLAARVERIRVERNADLIATVNYGLTAVVAYATGRPERVVQLNERIRYAFAAPVSDDDLAGRSAILVFRSSTLRLELLKRYFGEVVFVETVPRLSHGQVAASYDVYLVSHYRGGLLR